MERYFDKREHVEFYTLCIAREILKDADIYETP